MSTLRFRVVETAFTKKAVDVAVPDERPSEYFGKYVFNRAKMFKYLPENIGNWSMQSTMALLSIVKLPILWQKE